MTQSRNIKIKELDKLFSRYVRMKYSRNGYAKCVTCGSIIPTKEIQLGHYFSRKNMKVRWDEANCFPQCYTCNVMFYGRTDVYRSVLIDMLGEDEFEKLEKRARKHVKVSEADIDELIKKYKQLLKGLDDY